MLETTYLKLATSLPLVLPALAWGTGSAFRDETGTAGILVASLIVGGPPYVLGAAAGLAWLRGRPADAHRRLARIAPLLYVPILALWIVASRILGRTTWSLDDLTVALLISVVCALPLGYLYVGLVMVPRRWLVRAA